MLLLCTEHMKMTCCRRLFLFIKIDASDSIRRFHSNVINRSLLTGNKIKDMTSVNVNGCKEFYSTATTERKKYKICVEGNIGSGKTTLLDYFSKFPFTEAIKEPVDRWRNVRGFNALDLMYRDPNRWSLTFQTYVQLTMLQIHTQPQEKMIKMMERSIFSAKYCFVENLHNSGKMPEIDYIVLTEWFDYLVKTQDLNIDLIVYLQTKPETVYKRIKQRCRSEETHIPMEYLKSLHTLHEDWLVHKKFPLSAPVLILNGDGNKEEMVKEYEHHSPNILQGWTLDNTTTCI